MIRSSHRRGRHKVFIGMAPGVGKTCRMLQEGKEMLREGTDVVVGLAAAMDAPPWALAVQDPER